MQENTKFIKETELLNKFIDCAFKTKHNQREYKEQIVIKSMDCLMRYLHRKVRKSYGSLIGAGFNVKDTNLFQDEAFFILANKAFSPTEVSSKARFLALCQLIDKTHHFNITIWKSLLIELKDVCKNEKSKSLLFWIEEILFDLNEYSARLKTVLGDRLLDKCITFFYNDARRNTKKVAEYSIIAKKISKLERHIKNDKFFIGYYTISEEKKEYNESLGKHNKSLEKLFDTINKDVYLSISYYLPQWRIDKNYEGFFRLLKNSNDYSDEEKRCKFLSKLFEHILNGEIVKSSNKQMTFFKTIHDEKSYGNILPKEIIYHIMRLGLALERLELETTPAAESQESSCTTFEMDDFCGNKLS